MTNEQIPSIEQGPRPRRLRRRLGCAAIVLGLLIVLGLILFVSGRSLWRSEPAYWTANQSFIANTSEVELTDLADRAFNRILSELSYSRGYHQVDTGAGGSATKQSLGTRTIRLGFEEANAWLATRLDDWLVNQKRELPAGITGPMLASAGSSLAAVFRYKSPEVDQVFSIFMSLEFLDNGQAMLSVDGVRGGRLPLPTKTVLGQLPGVNEDDAQRSQTIAVLLGQQSFDPVLPIDGTRQARIIGMKVKEDGLYLVVQAEPYDGRGE